MNNENQWLPKTPKLRVETKHGGENVEEIDVANIVSVNDANCPHTNMSRDYSETEFVAFTCDNPNCGVVYIRDKV